MFSSYQLTTYYAMLVDSGAASVTTSTFVLFFANLPSLLTSGCARAAGDGRFSNIAPTFSPTNSRISTTFLILSISEITGICLCVDRFVTWSSGVCEENSKFIQGQEKTSNFKITCSLSRRLLMLICIQLGRIFGVSFDWLSPNSASRSSTRLPSERNSICE